MWKLFKVYPFRDVHVLSWVAVASVPGALRSLCKGTGTLAGWLFTKNSKRTWNRRMVNFVSALWNGYRTVLASVVERRNYQWSSWVRFSHTGVGSEVDSDWWFPIRLQMVQFECPRHWHPTLTLRLWEFQFPIFSIPLSEVIRTGLQYEDTNMGKFTKQNWLNRLHMVQFECPRH